MHHDGSCVLHPSLPRVFRDHGRHAGRAHCYRYDADGHIYNDAVRASVSLLYTGNADQRQKEGVRSLQHFGDEQIQPGKDTVLRNAVYMGSRDIRRTHCRHRDFQAGRARIYKADRSTCKICFLCSVHLCHHDSCNIQRDFFADLSQFAETSQFCKSNRAGDCR